MQYLLFFTKKCSKCEYCSLKINIECSDNIVLDMSKEVLNN